MQNCGQPLLLQGAAPANLRQLFRFGKSEREKKMRRRNVQYDANKRRTNVEMVTGTFKERALRLLNCIQDELVSGFCSFPLHKSFANQLKTTTKGDVLSSNLFLQFFVILEF